MSKPSQETIEPVPASSIEPGCYFRKPAGTSVCLRASDKSIRQRFGDSQVGTVYAVTQNGTVVSIRPDEPVKPATLMEFIRASGMRKASA